MEIKAYLERGNNLWRQIAKNKLNLAELRESAYSTPSIDHAAPKVQTSKRIDRTSSIIAKIVDLENELADDVDRYIKIHNDIRGIIARLDDGLAKLIFQRRYLCHQTMTDIAAEFDMTNSHCHGLHRRTLQKIRL